MRRRRPGCILAATHHLPPNNMAPKLYLKTQSPPCRAVLLVSRALNLELELEHVDFPDLLTPEMLKVGKQF